MKCLKQAAKADCFQDKDYWPQRQKADGGIWSMRMFSETAALRENNSKENNGKGNNSAENEASASEKSGRTALKSIPAHRRRE